MKRKTGFIYKLHSFQTRPHDGIYKAYIFTRVSTSESLCFIESTHTIRACMHVDWSLTLWPPLNPVLTSVYAHWSLKQLAEKER